MLVSIMHPLRKIMRPVGSMLSPKLIFFRQQRNCREHKQYVAAVCLLDGVSPRSVARSDRRNGARLGLETGAGSRRVNRPDRPDD